jgi:Zn-dependent oligopeptidase
MLAVTVGGVLLTGVACHSGDQATTTSAPSAVASLPAAEPSSAAPDYSADTELVCGKVQKVFTQDLKAFAVDLGKMIANKEAKQTAAAAAARKAAGDELKRVGATVKRETAAAQDPELRAAGAASAAKFVKTAGDDTFFNKIKSTSDLNKIIESQLTEWFTPVAGYCAA